MWPVVYSSDRCGVSATQNDRASNSDRRLRLMSAVLLVSPCKSVGSEREGGLHVNIMVQVWPGGGLPHVISTKQNVTRNKCKFLDSTSYLSIHQVVDSHRVA